MAVVFVLALAAVARPAFAERIRDYTVALTVNADATVDVVEEIVYDFEDSRRHGIYREMPVRYTTGGGNRRTIAVRNIAVAVDGARSAFAATRAHGKVVVKIGDAHTTVTGVHTYTLRYRVRGAINAFPDHAELYWNAIGTQWNVGIAAARVRVTAPRIVTQACFYGAYGARTACRTDAQSAQRVAFAVPALAPREGVTVVVGIASDAIALPTLWQRWWWFVRDNGIVFVPLVFAVWGGRQWWRYGRDPAGRGTIVPYYDVPENVSVAQAAAIVYNGLRARDIAAMVIQLAVKGFVTIAQKEPGGLLRQPVYVFTRSHAHRAKGAQLTAEETYLLDAMFAFAADDGTVTTDDLAGKFAPKVAALQKMIVRNLRAHGYLPRTPTYRGAGLIIVGVVQMLVLAALSTVWGSAALLAGIASLVILVGFALAMGHRTKKGVLAKEKLLGLKLYIETVEKDRLRFHNAPAKHPRQFEKFLPYAMVFGVEREWAQQFADLSMQPPAWYEGAQQGTFNAVVLADRLHAFGKVAAGTMASAPSSAGAGGSGFVGGGSGGGFGGGGGGSW